MLELEKKYRLSEDAREVVVAALNELGAVFERDDAEENTIYSGAPLAAVGGIVRIRRTQHRTLLTYKRRMEDLSDVKQQVEYETEISDADAADAILREMRLTPALVYEKRRSTWRFRDVEVVIDELPFGLYMEIEGPRTAIKEAEMLLGIEDLDAEQETYPRLTARLGRRNGDVIEARFN